MRPGTKTLALALLALLTATAWSEPSYVDLEKRLSAGQRHATGIDTLSPEQLANLNAILRGESRASSAAQDSRGRAPAARDFTGFSEGPIKARLKGTVSGWAPGTIFELDNGQRWQVLKGEMKLRKPMQAPAIIVVPGLAGRWFLQVDEDLPKARVFRVD